MLLPCQVLISTNYGVPEELTRAQGYISLVYVYLYSTVIEYDAFPPTATICYVANLYKVLCLKHTKMNETRGKIYRKNPLHVGIELKKHRNKV